MYLLLGAAVGSPHWKLLVVQLEALAAAWHGVTICETTPEYNFFEWEMSLVGERRQE
jgi:hypothetical protein